MLSITKGLVLRTVKYGETSVVVTIFTELSGLQTYLVNGVRTASKKGSTKTVFFQPAALLELVAYHNELKNLQRLKEFKWERLYRNIFSDVRKNAVAVFMVELLLKCLKQPEANPDLFYFSEDALLHLDEAPDAVTANLPLFYLLHLPFFFGFRINNNFSVENRILDLLEGRFVHEFPVHHFFLKEQDAAIVSDLLKVRHPAELEQLFLNVETRRRLMQTLEHYYRLHIPGFGAMKTLPVLREVLS